MAPWLTVLLLVATIAVLAGIPIVLLVIFGGRQKKMQAFMAEAWTATVLDVDYESVRVRQHVLGDAGPPLCIVLRYRREDGLEGTLRIPSEGAVQAVIQSTLQPMPPSGFYEHVDAAWVPGSVIRKPAGAFYPELVS